jgi:outer membrane receptor for ferrienterochelin and colicins
MKHSHLRWTTHCIALKCFRQLTIVSFLTIFLQPLCNAKALELEELLKMDIVDLAQVQIEVASRKRESVAEAPSVISVVTAKEIQGFGANNLVDILNRVTSVQAIGSHFYPHSISMRGQMVAHSNNDILFLINGRPHRTSWNGGTPERLLMAFPIDTIERIEIIRGPSSVLYGTGAFTGVINIITKTANKLKNGVGITLGSRSNNGGGSSAPFSSLGMKANVSYESDKADIAVGLKTFDTDGWTFTATDEQGVTESVQRGESNVGAMVTAGSGGFSLNMLYTDVKEDNIMGGPPVWPGGTHNISHLLLDAGYKMQFKPAWSFDNHITYNKFDFTFESSPPNVNTRNSKDVLLESTLSGRIFNKLDVLAGANYENINGIISSDLDYTSFRYSVFGQLDYAPLQLLKLTAGFQWNKVQYTDSDVSPRLGLVSNFSKNWGAKLLYGEAFRSAVATERFLPPGPGVQGNPSLHPEKIATTELQVFFTAQNTFAALTAFQSNITDAIDRVPDQSGQFVFENVGTVDSKGVELEGKTTFLDSWLFTGSASYQENKDENGNDASLAPSWMAKLGVVYRHRRGIDAGFYHSYFDAPTPVREVNPSVQEVNPEPNAYNYLTANVRLDLRELFGTTESMILSFYGDNLLNEEVYYPEFNRRQINSIPLYSGRAFYATFDVTL